MANAVNINERTQAGKSLYLYPDSLGVISKRLPQRRRSGTTEELEGWRMENPTGKQVIYVRCGTDVVPTWGRGRPRVVA